MKAAGRQLRIQRDIDVSPTPDRRARESNVILGVSRDSQRELQLTLAALVARTSLTAVVEGLANVVLEQSASQPDRSIGQAWHRAAQQLRDVASRVGAMPDPL
jgi:hypothetical protein